MNEEKSMVVSKIVSKKLKSAPFGQSRRRLIDSGCLMVLVLLDAVHTEGDG